MSGSPRRAPRPAPGLASGAVVLALALVPLGAVGARGAGAADAPARALERALKADDATARVAGVEEAGRVGNGAPGEEKRRIALALRKALERDPDGRVRVAAVRALARLSDEAALVALAVAAVRASDEGVRGAAVEAFLVARRDVVDVVRKLLREDVDPTFRADLTLLLGRRRRADAAPLLLETLGDPHPRVASAAAEALEAVSGEAHGYDEAAWRAWWERERARKPAPAGGGDTVTREAPAPEAPPPPPPARGLVPELYGIPLRAKDYVFVVDVSGSIGADGVASAKSELVKAVERLPSDVSFAAIFFDETLKTWHPELVRATPAHKADLARFVRGIPRGKRTDVMTPLNAGLAIVARRVAARRAAGEPAPEPVTMIVLSDGQENLRATPGDVVGEKLERLDLAHAVVHAIVLGGRDNAFMAAVARRAGGVYRVVP